MKIFAARRNHFEARDRATSKHIERKRHARKKGEIQITQPRSKHKGRQTHADTDRRKQTDTSKQTKHKQTHTHTHKNRHTQWTDTNTPHAHTNIQTNEHIHRSMDTLGLLPRRDSKRLRLSDLGNSASQLCSALHPWRNSNICNCCSLGRCKDRVKR